MGSGASVARPPALVEAEVRKLDAETAAVRERAKADAGRAAAEAAAARERSAAEAATARERSAADAASLLRRDVVLLSPLAHAVLATAALAVDRYLHESPTHL